RSVPDARGHAAVRPGPRSTRLHAVPDHEPCVGRGHTEADPRRLDARGQHHAPTRLDQGTHATLWRPRVPLHATTRRPQCAAVLTCTARPARPQTGVAHYTCARARAPCVYFISLNQVWQVWQLSQAP